MMFSISGLTSVFDLKPSRETVSWQGLVTLFSKPQRALCTQQTCPRGNCPYKRGGCWSPASFTETRLRAAEAVSLLVFDVDQEPENQIDKIRKRLDPLQYLMHSTHSDRPNSRCLRIVFPLSRPVVPGAWRSFWQETQQDLVPIADLCHADAKCFYFLPSRPSDASYFLQTNEGTVLDVDQYLTAGSPSREEKIELKDGTSSVTAAANGAVPAREQL